MILKNAKVWKCLGICRRELSDAEIGFRPKMGCPYCGGALTNIRADAKQQDKSLLLSLVGAPSLPKEVLNHIADGLKHLNITAPPSPE